MVLSVLEAEVKKLVDNIDDPKELGKRAKARYMWNENTMNQLSNHLGRQQVAITLLLQSLQVYVLVVIQCGTVLKLTCYI